MSNYSGNALYLIKLLLLFVLLCSISACVDLSGSSSKSFGKKKSGKQTSYYPKDYKGKKVVPYGEIHALRGGLGIFSLAMNKMQTVVSEKYNVPGSSTMWYSAGEMSKAVIDYHYKHHSNRPVILIGHSLGANEQLKVARNLDKAGIPVALLVTIDAVSQTSVPGNVEHVLNIYKPGYVPMFSGLKVKAVNPKATLVENVNIKDLKGVNVHHFNIANNKVVQDLVLAEIGKVLLDAKRRG